MASRRARGRRRFRPAPGSGSRGCSTRCPRGASSCARPRAEYAACLDAVKRLAMARSDVGFTLDHDGRRILTLQPAEPPARVAELLTHELDRHGIGIDCARDGLRLDRRDQPADLQPRRRRPAISVRQLAAGEGPAAGRRAARRLSRPDRPRPPPDRRLVPRGPARRGRRQRPPGQDRGPLPRSGGGARADRRRPPPRARRGEPAQRRARAGGGAGHVDDERESTDQQSTRHPSERSGPAVRTNRAPAFAGATAVARSAAALRPSARRPRRAGGRAGAELSRSASPAARSPRPISSPRPRTGWSSSTSMPRTSGWCSSGCAPRARAARSRARRC